MSSAVSCIAAYNSISINADGTIEPCCQYTRDPRAKRLKFTEFAEYQNTIQRHMHQDAEAGVQHLGCQKCWNEEAAGWKTLRNSFNNWYLPIASKSVSKENPFYDIELRLGNFCNLKCIMCGSYASSSIALERLQNSEKFNALGMSTKIVQHDHYWETPEFLNFSTVLFNDARRVNITGGEPFIIPEVINIIDRLLPKKDTVKLSFNTNLTKLSDKLVSRLEQFKHLIINVSLEGVEEMNDYLRYPSKWNELLENFEKVKSKLPKAYISVNHTFQHSSIYALPRLAEFCTVNKINLFLTSVQGDAMLTINSVPTEDVDVFKNWAETTPHLFDTGPRQYILGYIDTHRYDQLQHKRYYDYVSALDEIRGTDYYATFTQATKYIDN